MFSPDSVELEEAVRDIPMVMILFPGPPPPGELRSALHLIIRGRWTPRQALTPTGAIGLVREPRAGH